MKNRFFLRELRVLRGLLNILEFTTKVTKNTKGFESARNFRLRFDVLFFSG